MPAPFEVLANALVIPVPEDPALVLDGCRRLLGPNLYSDLPGAVGDGLAQHPHFREDLVLDFEDFEQDGFHGAGLARAKWVVKRPAPGNVVVRFCSVPVGG